MPVGGIASASPRVSEPWKGSQLSRMNRTLPLLPVTFTVDRSRSLCVRILAKGVPPSPPLHDIRGRLIEIFTQNHQAQVSRFLLAPPRGTNVFGQTDHLPIKWMETLVKSKQEPQPQYACALGGCRNGGVISGTAFWLRQWCCRCSVSLGYSTFLLECYGVRL